MKSIFKSVLIWRVVLFAVAAMALKNIGYLFPYPNYQYLIRLGHEIPLLWTWGGFDGVHYITIAESGYVADNTQAFFPVFPYISGWIHNILNINGLFSGLLTANIFLFLAILGFWKLLKLDYGNILSKQIIYLFLLFPLSFYLGSVYSESTFLALVLASFLAARKQKWAAAGILGAVASAARPVGVFLMPALLVELWQQKQIKNLRRADFIKILWLLLIPLGLIFYMIYLNNHFGDALKFLHAQPSFGADRSDKIVLLYQVIWRYIKMFFTVDIGTLLYFRVMQEFFLSIVFLILGVLSFKYSRLSYAIFAILCFLAPTLTGTFSSMPRYVLVMFPVFIIWGKWLFKHDRIRRIWYVISGIWLFINMSLFLTGRWVA